MVNDDTVDHRVIPQLYPIITGETILGQCSKSANEQGESPSVGVGWIWSACKYKSSKQL